MLAKFKQLQKLWAQKFTEAWTSCMIAMVGGNMSIISWYHAGVAAKVGAAGATAVVVTYLFLNNTNRWLQAWLTGVFVMLADLMFVKQHTQYYGDANIWTEAALTGLGAAMIGLVLSGALYRK